MNSEILTNSYIINYSNDHCHILKRIILKFQFQMKILKLPHLPSKFDVVIYDCLKQFIIIPPNCFIKVSEMSKVRPKLTPIDLNTIFGVVRSKLVILVVNYSLRMFYQSIFAF